MNKNRPNTSETLRIFLSGDVMTGRGIDQILPHSVNPRIYEPYVKDARDYVRLAEKKYGSINQPVNYKYIWGDALKVWKKESPALKIINLETSVTKNGEPWPGKGIQYRMHPKNIDVLTVANIDFVTLANNHTLDWSRSGLEETLKTLKEANVTIAGAGEDLQEAKEPAVLNTKKGRVIILAYGSESSGVPGEWAATSDRSGVNFLPDLSESTIENIKEQVNAVKETGDIVIFSVHWGSNWGYQVPQKQREFAHKLIDEADVDIIHGHSSHHPRGLEVYKNKLIMYGAGDFINDYEGIQGHEQFRDDLTLMYFPIIDPPTGNIVDMKMVPMQIMNFRLNHASHEDAQWLFETLNKESKKFDTELRLNEDYTFSLKI
ncbi:MAG: CapA family protein [Candidatus Cyclobacteriaceae bacterium M2_1C_046]